MNHTAFFLAAILSATALHGQGQSVPRPASASDTTPRRFEIGGQFTDLVLGTAGQTGAAESAFGPEFAFNLNRYLAVNASYSVLKLPQCLFPSCTGGRQSTFIGGLRAEAREKHYGMFAYGRPGVLHTNAWTNTEPLPGFMTTTVSSPGSSQFVSDVGGGIEYFAPSRIHAKVELGDLLLYQGCAQCYHWTNHVQFSTGVYAMIGKPVPGGQFNAEGEQPHRFLDRTNLLFLAVSLLGQSAEAITTQRFHGHGGQEADPLARPFVDQGWGGQVGEAVIVNAAQILVMYRLHKMGHHSIERIVPLVRAFGGGYEGYHNLQHQ